MKGIIKLNFKTAEIIEGKNFAKIRWEVSSENIIPIYDYIYNLYSNSEGTQTTMIREMIYKEEFMQSKIEEEDFQLENYIIFKNIEECIDREKVSKSQVEEIIINKNLNFIWNSLLNLKEFQKKFPLICDSIEYEGEEIKEGMNITLEWNKKQKGICHLKIKSIFNSPDLCTLTLESVNSNPKVPNQLIEWKIENIPDANLPSCKIRLTHFYNEIISKESLLYTSKIKKEMLASIKKSMEECICS